MLAESEDEVAGKMFVKEWDEMVTRVLVLTIDSVNKPPGVAVVKDDAVGVIEAGTLVAPISGDKPNDEES